VKQVYTIRDVIKHKYRKLIYEENPCQPTDKGYLGCYQKAVSKVQQDMTEKDQEDLQNIADLWNSEGAPSEMKLK
jgi:hypothetical protein